MKTAIGKKTFDHSAWISKLKTFKNEFVWLEQKLAEITSANNRKTEVLSRVEHFQNQFIVQKSNLNGIIHALKMDEKEQNFKQLTGTWNENDKETNDLKDVAETFEKTMNELKKEFNSFSVKNHIV